jgi:hypothetical protein
VKVPKADAELQARTEVLAGKLYKCVGVEDVAEMKLVEFQKGTISGRRITDGQLGIASTKIAGLETFASVPSDMSEIRDLKILEGFHVKMGVSW